MEEPEVGDCVTVYLQSLRNRLQDMRFVSRTLHLPQLLEKTRAELWIAPIIPIEEPKLKALAEPGASTGVLTKFIK